MLRTKVVIANPARPRGPGSAGLHPIRLRSAGLSRRTAGFPARILTPWCCSFPRGACTPQTHAHRCPKKKVAIPTMLMGRKLLYIWSFRPINVEPGSDREDDEAEDAGDDAVDAEG